MNLSQSYIKAQSKNVPNYFGARKREWNEEDHPRVPAGNGDESGQFTENDKGIITHVDIKNILDKALIKNNLSVSHSYGSHYWDIDGESYRVSDHTKPKGGFGEEKYRGKLGINDFRSYNEFYIALKSKYDLSDKSNYRELYYKSAASYIKHDGGYYKTPEGSIFDNKDNALNNMFSGKYIIETESESLNKWIRHENYKRKLKEAYLDADAVLIKHYKNLLGI